MTVHVASTLTTDVKFEQHASDPGASFPRVVRKVLIRGGANRADRRLETPPAVVTEVSDEDYAFLKDHDSFKGFVARGYMTVAGKREDAEVIAAAMSRGDKSAQLVPEDETVQITDNRGQLHTPSAGRPRAA